MLDYYTIIVPIRSRVTSHDNVVRQLQKERDLAQDELANMHSVLDQETASLRFQLSTVQMELKQAKKVIAAVVCACLMSLYCTLSWLLVVVFFGCFFPYQIFLVEDVTRYASFDCFHCWYISVIPLSSRKLG